MSDPIPPESNGRSSSLSAFAPPDKNVGAELRLSHDEWGRLVLHDWNGKDHVGIEPVRAFPLSDPDQWISLCDAEGRELVCFPDLTGLPAATRELLKKELSSREFIPVIQRIVRISSGSDPREWIVESNRGPITFMVTSDEDTRRLDNHRVMVKDSQGMRYLIADSRQLDGSSRRLLAKYM